MAAINHLNYNKGVAQYSTYRKTGVAEFSLPTTPIVYMRQPLIDAPIKRWRINLSGSTVLHNCKYTVGACIPRSSYSVTAYAFMHLLKESRAL